MDSWNYDEMLQTARAGRLDTEGWRRVRRRAQAGDAGAQYVLSLSDLTRRTRRRWLKAAAERGHAEAFRELYDFYPTSNEGGWLQKSAEAGSADAQNALGVHYAWIPDHVNMRYWYLQAALQGHPNAQYEIGFTLLLGEGGPTDPVQAISWLEKAATSDHDIARLTCRLLGDVYGGGLYGVSEDPARAAHWRALANDSDSDS
jgi:TPR repeat protein